MWRIGDTINQPNGMVAASDGHHSHHGFETWEAAAARLEKALVPRVPRTIPGVFMRRRTYLYMPPLVAEFHYQDGDVGAHNDVVEATQLWAQFPRSHVPSHILIRHDTDQGQQLSDVLKRASKVEVALRAFIDTVNATGGVVRPDTSFVAPAADEDWLDLGFAYMQACQALGLVPPVVANSEDPEVKSSDQA